MNRIGLFTVGLVSQTKTDLSFVQDSKVQKINSQDNDSICVEVDDDFLNDHEIEGKEKIHLWDDECRGTQNISSTGTYWRWCTNRMKTNELNEKKEFDCGTQSQINLTHLVYKNALTRNIEAGDIIIGSSAYRQLSMPFGCSWPLNVFVSTSHDADFDVHDTILLESDVSGVGSYKAKMYLYSDEQFDERLGKSPVLEMDEKVYVGVELLDSIDGVNVIIERAWATAEPSPDSNSFQVPIVDHRCPSLFAAKEMDVQLFSNGQNSLASFSTSVFKIGDADASYLHAEVKVCFEDENTCPTQSLQCLPEVEYGPKSRKSRSSDEKNVVSIGPIYLNALKTDYHIENIELNKNLLNENNIEEVGRQTNKANFMDKTDLIIAVLLAVVCLLSLTVITLYVRWKKATKNKNKRQKNTNNLNEVVTVTR